MIKDYPSTNISKGIDKIISKSRLHRGAAKTLVLPCLDVIEWMTWRIDNERRTILNFEDKKLVSYRNPVLNQPYHLKETQVNVTLELLQRKTKLSISYLS